MRQALTTAKRTSGVTVKEVAARAGVSTATVSRVLNGKGGVSKELEQRVLQSIEALSFRPNIAARRLRQRKAKIIGVLVPDIQIPFFASIVVAIEKNLQDAGYLLLLGNTNDDLGSEARHINTFLAEGVMGVIFALADAVDQSNYIQLLDSGIHLVAFDRSPGSLQVDTVQVNNAQSISHAFNHLMEEGHTQIGFLAGPDSISTSVERLKGYSQSVIAAGWHLNHELVQQSDYTLNGGYQAMNKLLDQPCPPSAVLISNGPMTLGAMQSIYEHGLEIPGDISLVSFDDLPWSFVLRPPLTAIVQPSQEIGEYAARLMLDRIRNPKSSIKHIMLETRFIVRESCRCTLAQPILQA